MVVNHPYNLYHHIHCNYQIIITLLGKTNVSRYYVNVHNMIIEDEFDAHESIVDLNVMFVLKINIILDKTKQFQWFISRHK